jgi:hypothetical protein
VGLQIGHETISKDISKILFRNIDILEQRNRYIGHYAMGIFNGDTATVSDVAFEDIRVENCERLVMLIVEKGFFNRAATRGRIENIRFKNIRSSTTLDLHLYGFDDEHAIKNVGFEDLYQNGQRAQPEIFTNLHVHDVTVKADGRQMAVMRSMLKPGTKFVTLDIAPACNRSRIDKMAGDGKGWFDLGPELDMKDLKGGVQTLGGVPFHIPQDPERGAIVLRSAQRLVNQPYASYPITIGRKADYLFFLHGTAFTDAFVPKVPPEVWIGDAGKLRFNQSKTGTPLWHYIVRYKDDGTEIRIPVKAGYNVEDWEIWAPGGWVVPLCGRKFYIQKWENPYPEKTIDSIKVYTALQPEVPAVLGISVGVVETGGTEAGDKNQTRP